jgi:predicted RNase H-like nuclease (RuvC/YqgF family)
MDWLVYIAPLAGLGGLAAFLGWIYAVYRDKQKRPGEEIDQAIEQWKVVLGGTVDELRSRNDELREINREQKDEIDRLEKEIDRLEVMVRSLTQQNMDVGQEAKRVRRELDELMAEHHQLLGRLKGRDDVA